MQVGFLPLFGGLGYEYALACGLLLPSAAAVWTALATASESRERDPIDSVLWGLLRGGALAGIALLLGLFHGLLGGLCDLWGGLAGFLLGPGIGALLGGVWGAVAGEIARSRRHRRLVAVLLAVLGPATGVAISVGRFYRSPMIFAFDPFVGYFSGTLYDTVVDAGPALWSYRAGSVAFASAVLCTASVLRRSGPSLRLEVARDRSFWARAAFALLLFGACVAELALGARLGHWSTSATIAAELGGQRHGARCDVVFPSSLRDDEAALLVKDCDDQVAQVEKTLGTRGPSRITAFFFHDAAEKRRLMGAADTYIAKPWREEVYLQMASYPHPVLGHELAHVIAGSFGRGPFRIAGSLDGLFPNPGLIEGVAVAASPDEDELTDLEWAAAMKKRDALPPMERIFSAGFLGESAAKSYTLAGAFIRWMADQKGWQSVRAWYSGSASVESIFGEDWSAIDAAFRASLDSIALPPAAEAYVASKFQRPSVFGRKCPHEVDALRHEADGCRDAHQIARARELYDEALSRDPHEPGTRLARAVMELRSGDARRGRAEVEAISRDEHEPLSVRHKAKDALADQDMLDGKLDRAAEEYQALAAETPDEDAARTLEVKAIAARDPDARAAVTALLIGSETRPSDPALAAGLIGEWEGKTLAAPAAEHGSSSVLASYLLGKNVVSRGYYAEAAPRFDRVLAAPQGEGITPRIRRESLRQRAVCACALGDADAIGRLRALAESSDGPYAASAGGRRESVLRLLERCAPLRAPEP